MENKLKYIQLKWHCGYSYELTWEGSESIVIEVRSMAASKDIRVKKDYNKIMSWAKKA